MTHRLSLWVLALALILAVPAASFAQEATVTGTITDSPVAESRFIDEQVEWLDAAHILYTQPDSTGRSAAVSDVWMVAADGSGEPTLLLREAATPTVMHPGKNALTP